MFGLQNLGVINQKNAPAIWESAELDFPTNFVKGRILINTNNGAIYIDTETTRVQIQGGNSGDVEFRNGLEVVSATNFDKTVTLGGSLINTTILDLNGNSFIFSGALVDTKLNTDGRLLVDNNPVVTNANTTIGVTVPNKTLHLNIEGTTYQVNAL